MHTGMAGRPCTHRAEDTNSTKSMSNGPMRRRIRRHAEMAQVRLFGRRQRCHSGQKMCAGLGGRGGRWRLRYAFRCMTNHARDSVSEERIEGTARYREPCSAPTSLPSHIPLLSRRLRSLLWPQCPWRPFVNKFLHVEQRVPSAK
jgi:hypothetical protein